MRRIFFYLLFLLCFTNALPQQTSHEIVPADVLFKKINHSTFSISPNGRYFAEMIRENGKYEIIVVDIDKYQLHQRIPLGWYEADNIYWLNDNRLLYEALGEILAVDIDGSNRMLIVNKIADNPKRGYYSYYKNYRYNKLISMYPANKNEILVQTMNSEGYASINRVNIYTGSKVLVKDGAREKINGWVTDIDGEPRLAIRYQDESLSFLKYNNSRGKWEQFHVKIEGKDYPLVVEANSYLNQNLIFESFSYDKDIAYLTTNINSDKRKLISYDMKQELIVDTLLEDINCDVKNPMGADLSFIFDYVNDELAGLRYESLVPQFKWYSEKFAGVHSSINEKYPGFVHDLIDADMKNERFLFWQWSDTNAGNIGVYDSTDDSYAVMFHFNEELNKYKLSKTRNLIITTRDDYKVPCYLNLPINLAKDEKIPLIVVPHGGPWARDYWDIDAYCQFLSTRGFATLRVNFRGSTGFGRNHVEAGVKSIDEVMINDIADATREVMARQNIDPEQVFILGHSYGGYAVYMSLLQYPELYKSGVAISAPTDIKGWMKGKKKEKEYFTYEFWNTALGSNDSKYLQKISPISYARDFDRPVLIFHGQKDKTIPVEQAEEMIEELKSYGKKARYENLKNEGHSISDSNTLGYVLDQSIIFFKNSTAKSE